MTDEYRFGWFFSMDDTCPKCGKPVDQYLDTDLGDLVLAERCQTPGCRWQVNFDRDEKGRKVRYGSPVEVLR